MTKVSELAYKQVSEFGMNDRLGPVIFKKPFSQETRRIIEEVTRAKTKSKALPIAILIFDPFFDVGSNADEVISKDSIFAAAELKAHLSRSVSEGRKFL